MDKDVKNVAHIKGYISMVQNNNIYQGFTESEVLENLMH